MAKAIITLDGEEFEIEIGGKSILNALLDAGYNPPFSCASGVCTTCMAKLKEGKIEMDVNYGLDDSDVEDGFILTCQSIPQSEVVVISYDF